jgi:hypothetical protein
VGLRDVTGVFSRFFVVGFFVPTFVAAFLVAVAFFVADADTNTNTTTTTTTNKDTDTTTITITNESTITDNEVLVVGGVALVVALVLVGLRHRVWQLFEDWPRNHSYFGRKTHEYHCRIRTRWGLDVYRAWPMIQPLFNEREVELDIDGRSDVHFFLNCCLGALVVALALFVDAVVSPVSGHAWLSAVLGVLAVVVFAVSYVFAARAVMPWGDFKEAAAIRHRAELCKQFGIELSPGGVEPGEAARTVSELLNPAVGEDRPWRRRKCPS